MSVLNTGSEEKVCGEVEGEAVETSGAGSEQALVTLDAIGAAAERIAAFVRCSPMVAMTPSRLRLKAESLHETGAFKLRGAFNSILLLKESERRRGVIAYSSGNHAQAVAYAARVLGVKAVVVMPESALKAKVEWTLRWGAQVVIEGRSSDELAAVASRLAHEHGYSTIHPFDSHSILGATGGIGLEVLRQAPDVELVAVAVGGGGLIGGVAAAIKLTNAHVKVIGVEPELSADAYQSFKAGRLVTLSAEEVARTVADGLRVQRLGSLNWLHIRAFVDDIITVSEREICQTVRDIAVEARLVAEPSGAVAATGALKLGADHSRAVAIVSGGNVDSETLATILRGETV